MRTKLTAELKWFGILDLGISLFCLIVFLNNMFNSNSSADVNYSMLLFIAIFGIIGYLCIKAKTIEFDENYIYLISTRNENKIPLENLIKVKLTMTSINNRNLWKIKYFDNQGLEKNIRFMPKILYKNFDQFKINTIKKNKNVEFKNWSTNFDFDL